MTIPLSLSFDFPQTTRSNYIAVYFTEVIQLSVEQNRSFNMLIDGQDYQLSIAPRYQICDELARTT
ncbi:hypothetical protein QJS04_geneDACA014656 [Acorus gramineus]|uniref:Malectin-like domain-containing protein n=1 Tax=Acorus gramineus TaxID=55184 RepID=A0AAV9B6C7_ACOGR|nr:hypothetical protein QJS04_geneDACA014656 [Acorus gramineus]